MYKRVYVGVHDDPGARGSLVLEALRYNPSGRTMALGSTQPLTEMSTRCISWG